jgi:hypothetical protein
LQKAARISFRLRRAFFARAQGCTPANEERSADAVRLQMALISPPA